jgi:hypothetical protein
MQPWSTSSPMGESTAATGESEGTTGDPRGEEASTAETSGATGSQESGTGEASSSAGSSSSTGGETGCPADHVCFELPGPFHVADEAMPTATYDIEIPEGAEYAVVEVDLDVTISEWYPPDPEGLHNLFWLHRGRVGDFTWRGGVLGYVNLRGPNQNLVRTRHDLDAPRLEQPVFNINGVALQPGHTYHVFYRYDTIAAEVLVRITEGATVVAEGTDVPTTDRVRNTDRGYFVYFANGTDVSAPGPEVPSLGWTYAALRVEFIAADEP